jgi:RHS repeat-associated protein
MSGGRSVRYRIAGINGDGGNGRTTTYSYDYRQRLINIKTGTQQDLTLTYDAAGNITGVTDATAGEVATYLYDDTNRLTEMKIGGATVASYAYNAIGNMLTKSEAASLSMTYGPQVTCAAGTRTLPHAVVSTTGAQALTLAYDCNGNLASVTPQGGPATTYTFDVENRLKTRATASGTISYTYDGNGTMLKRTNADGSSVRYIGGLFEEQRNAAGAVTLTTKYYQAFGRSIAVRHVPAMGPDVLYYLLSDHLGGTVEVLGSNGSTVSETKYWPYGAVRGTGFIAQTDKWFTGQQVEGYDPALGLYNYGARFYSTALGRFVSGDPFPLDGLNRYHYVRSNPLRYVDPTGRCVAKLRCTPADALNHVACAHSFDSCAAVFFALGFKHDRNAISDAVRWARAATRTLEFRVRFSRLDTNPFRLENRHELGEGYVDPGFADPLLDEAAKFLALPSGDDVTARVEGIEDRFAQACGADGTRCAGLGFDLIDLSLITYGIFWGDPSGILMPLAQSSAFTAEVQLAWLAYQNGEATEETLWATVLGGTVNLLPSAEAQLITFTVIQYQELWCQPEGCGFNARPADPRLYPAP